MTKEAGAGALPGYLDTFLSPEVDRRTFLQGVQRLAVAGLAGHALARLDSYGADLMYGVPHGAELRDLVSPDDAPKSQEGCLIFTGMGTAPGEQSASYLRGLLPDHTPISWLEYDPIAMDKKNIAENLAHHAQRLARNGQRISLVDLSAGNPIEKRASYYLAEHEGVTIQPRREMLLSVPWNYHNIEGGFKRFISNSLADLEIEGTWSVAEIGGMGQEVRDIFTGRKPLQFNALDMPGSIVRFLLASDKRARGSQPIKWWLSANRAIHEVNHYDHLKTLHRIRTNTATLLWSSKNDGVVEMPQATNDGSAIYAQAGLPAPVVCEMRNDGHANFASVVLNSTVKRWLKQSAPVQDSQPV